MGHGSKSAFVATIVSVLDRTDLAGMGARPGRAPTFARAAGGGGPRRGKPILAMTPHAQF